MLDKKIKLEVKSNYGGEVSDTIKERIENILSEEIEKCSKEFFRDIDIKLEINVK